MKPQGMQNQLPPDLQQQLMQNQQMQQQQQAGMQGGMQAPPGLGGNNIFQNLAQAGGAMGGRFGPQNPMVPPGRGEMPLPPSAQPRMQPPAYGAGGRFGQPNYGNPGVDLDTGAGGPMAPPRIAPPGMPPPRGIPEGGMARPDMGAMQQKIAAATQAANAQRDAFRASNPMPAPGMPGAPTINMKPFRGGPNEGRIAGPDRAEALSALKPAMGGMKPPGGANYFSNSIKGTSKNPATRPTVVKKPATPQIKNTVSRSNPKAAPGAKAQAFGLRRRM